MKWKDKGKVLDIGISLVGLKSKIKDHSVEVAGRKLQKTRRLIGKIGSKNRKHCDKQGEREVKEDQK